MFVQSVRLLTLFCFIATYSTISDEQLDHMADRRFSSADTSKSARRRSSPRIVREAQSRNPNTGIRLTKGFVMGKGHRVQHYRIRESLIRTDPAGMMDRWAQTVRRRKYQVHSPLSLWHIDGNHKLIRYNI